uniref:F-box domain-containing protein n=1 Tax=Caenorhabditis tropicalis TaxID=1561998 RepID=A0A1I7TUS0_9PELO
MFSKDILSLPTVVIEHIFKRTPIYDLVNFSLSSEFANFAVNQFNYHVTPSIEVTIKRKNELDFYVEIGVLGCSGVWSIEKKDRKSPRIMEKIGDNLVVISRKSSEALTILTMDILKTTSSLVHHIQSIFKTIDLTVTFDDIMLSEISGISQWKLVSEAKKVKLIDSIVDSWSEFQRLLTPGQDLLLDGASIEFQDGLTEGGLDRLKSFKILNADYQWMLFGFGGTLWTQGPRIYETEEGEKIDCSNGNDWVREDGRVCTLVFTMEGIKEDPMETEVTARRTALFLVWP